MNLLKTRLQDPIYRWGLIFNAASLSLFCLPFFVTTNENRFNFFVGSFFITWAYFIFLIVRRKRMEGENRIHYTFLFLTLFLTSAYSLNREIPVFEDSADWFSVLLVTSCANYLSFAYARVLPKWGVHLMSFIAGISWLAFLYLTLYMCPIYIFGLIGVILIGFSLHVFAPLLFTIYSFALLNRTAEANKKYWWSFLAGITVALAFVIGYLVMWNDTRSQINETWSNSIKNNEELPAWVTAGQKMPDNFFSRKLLRMNLVYHSPAHTGQNFFWGMPFSKLDEPKKHDPLVTTAAFIAGELSMEDDDKIDILKSKFALRHEANDRLWSGDDLITESVNTEVRFWPACNITYTEKTLTVTNKAEKTWQRQQEAIYTFYMPEGGVVTSLSLWVNGKEEKSFLTTKELADSAYKSIVGVERRDPSVVHWQEGNTVSVRVFPVLAGESRKFKIGITAPLERVNGKLKYDNIYFAGPVFDNASENIFIDFEQPVNDFQLPASFTSMSRQTYKRQGRYESMWSMVINDPGLSGCSFSADNNTYTTLPYHRELLPRNFQRIYLDINRAWSREEFDKIIEIAKGKELFVYDSVIKKLDDDNKDKLWNDLHVMHFSLFPLFEIENPKESLLITKNTALSPSIDDLGESAFMSKTKAFFSNEKINLYDLGTELSAFLKSLKEFRVFQYDRGGVDQLQGLLKNNYFPDDLEDDNRVIIHKSDMVIQKTAGMNACSGPDHMMRLFTYNHIMQQLGRSELAGRVAKKELVDEARKAWVVTPVSSLIVLETQQDYDRFNIHDGGSVLKNASLQSKGAVPEPHEWAIIITIVLLLAWLLRKNKFRYDRVS
jgi:XrtN system VIT domain protein